MGGCAAPFCNNSAQKGYKMKVFPRNPQRRALWEQNVQRKNWTATNNSFLCEMHFSSEMWEEKQDGKRKLKLDAIPTIFGFFLKKNNKTDEASMESIKDAKEEQMSINTLLLNQKDSENDTKNTTDKCIINDIPEYNIESNNVNADSTLENNMAELAECTTILTSDASISHNVYDKGNKKQTEKFEDIITKQKLRMIRMQMKMKAMHYKIHSLQQKINNDKYKMALRRIFNKDQIALLCTTKNKKNKSWSNETVQRALKLKLVCGSNGYEEIINQGMPFPSLRTLRRRLENLKFKPGISEKMFDFLTYKKSYFCKNTDLECGLVFDEIAITPRKCYDPSSEIIIGDIKFPNETGIATHALVFMLVDIANRWKHVIGYHFTGNSFSSKTAKEIIFQIIHKAEAVGFHVNFITSDMGPGNIGLWKLLGISTGRYSKIINCIIHPCDKNRYLYVIADPPHLLKNLKQALISNKVITISENTVHKYKLPTNKIYLQHFDELLSIQENSELLLTPRLKATNIKCINSFSKMRVNKAKNVFSNDVTCTHTQKKCKSDRATSAWYILGNANAGGIVTFKPHNSKST